MSASDPPQWDAETLYAAGDRVVYNGQTWEADIQSRNAEPSSSSTYWSVVDSGGGSDTGNGGPPTWDNATLYTVGDVVLFEGQTYRAAINSRNAEPSLSSPYWTRPSASRSESGTIEVSDATQTLAEEIGALNSEIPDDHNFSDPALQQLKLRVELLENRLNKLR